MAGGRSSSEIWMVLVVVETVGFEPAMFLLSNTEQVHKYNIYIEKYSRFFSVSGAVDTSLDSQWWSPGFKTSLGWYILSISTVVKKYKIYKCKDILHPPVSVAQWLRQRTPNDGVLDQYQCKEVYSFNYYSGEEV